MSTDTPGLAKNLSMEARGTIYRDYHSREEAPYEFVANKHDVSINTAKNIVEDMDEKDKRSEIDVYIDIYTSVENNIKKKLKGCDPSKKQEIDQNSVNDLCENFKELSTSSTPPNLTSTPAHDTPAHDTPDHDTPSNGTPSRKSSAPPSSSRKRETTRVKRNLCFPRMPRITEEIHELTDDEVAERLKSYNVEKNTKDIEQNRLAYKSYLCLIEGEGIGRYKEYSLELSLVMNEIFSADYCLELDEGDFGLKKFFNYLLLDPTNLHCNSDPAFKDFVESVFYVGKASGGRPEDHLKLAAGGKDGKMQKYMKKKIGELRKQNYGVIILELFHHSCDNDALTMEACMMDALRFQSTNAKWGTHKRDWDINKRRRVGVQVLYQAYKIYKSQPHPPQQYYYDEYYPC